jgi:hypothetical protein
MVSIHKKSRPWPEIYTQVQPYIQETDVVNDGHVMIPRREYDDGSVLNGHYGIVWFTRIRRFRVKIWDSVQTDFSARK